MLYINVQSISEIEQRFPKYKIIGHAPEKSWQTSRYIQILPKQNDPYLHYEYRIDSDKNGRIEIHFEGHDFETKYGNLVDSLMNSTQNNAELSWTDYLGDYGYCCQHTKKIDNIDELYDTLSYMMNIFGKLIQEASCKMASPDQVQQIKCNATLPPQTAPVELYEKKYGEIIRLPLSIPNYQRIYCWEENNVKCLLNDIFEHLNSNTSTPYRLGTIILHSHDGKYDIIDGQQRLVTLALLLSELGVRTGLLDESLTSKRSIQYVAYNKYLIHEFMQHRMNLYGKSDKLTEMLEFSVLILQNSSIDLAYTFFSNQNSRGIALSDYDLLKAHHLRFIPSSFEKQSKHVVEVWNNMIESGRNNCDENESPNYVTVLDTYIYRLRKWMRKRDCEDGDNNYRIKNEYEAASIIEEIPPFGEKFYFNEPIQGGVYFFSYVELHINKFTQFCKTQEYNILHHEIQGSSNQWYRDIIESVLFCYFLKFGNYYLSEALVVTMRIVLQHRYDNARSSKQSIVRHVRDSELVMMIDQATSPTFFLAEAYNIAKELSYPLRQNMQPIMKSMRTKASKITKGLARNIVIESFKNLNR